jgi:hypothetical protein
LFHLNQTALTNTRYEIVYQTIECGRVIHLEPVTCHREIWRELAATLCATPGHQESNLCGYTKYELSYWLTLLAIQLMLSKMTPLSVTSDLLYANRGIFRSGRGFLSETLDGYIRNVGGFRSKAFRFSVIPLEPASITEFRFVRSVIIPL